MTAFSWNIVCILAILVVGNCCHVDVYRDWADNRLTNLFGNSSSGNRCQVLSAGALRSPDSVPNVTLTLFQKDEYELLSDWLQYHAHMFGLSTIQVVDNMSEGEAVCKLLAMYKLCGVTIIENTALYKERVAKMSEVLRNQPGKFLIPLDADEFLVSRAEDGVITFDPTSMAEYFEHLLVDGRKYKFHDVINVMYDEETCSHDVNVPRRRVALPAFLAHNVYKPAMIKTFFLSDGFIGTDQGNHRGHVKHDDEVRAKHPKAEAIDLSELYIRTNLSLFHYSVPSYRMHGAKVIRGAEAYGYNAATECVDGMTGSHYCTAAKQYQAHTPASHATFMAQCHARPGMEADTQFADWSLRNMLSMEQLIDAPIIPIF
jgi:hypothetical protein